MSLSANSTSTSSISVAVDGTGTDGILDMMGVVSFDRPMIFLTAAAAFQTRALQI
jgi:hypothetical protein